METLHIQKVVFSSNSSAAKVELYFDGTSISGGTSVIPLNMNRSSALASETTCLTGATTLNATEASANEMFDVRLNNASFEMDFDGGIVLKKNDNILILGEVATIGDKIRTMMYFYEEAD